MVEHKNNYKLNNGNGSNRPLHCLSLQYKLKCSYLPQSSHFLLSLVYSSYSTLVLDFHRFRRFLRIMIGLKISALHKIKQLIISENCFKSPI